MRARVTLALFVVSIAAASMALAQDLSRRSSRAHPQRTEADHSAHQMGQPPQAAPMPRDPKLPAGAEHAAEAIKISPRHGEYVDVKVPGQEKPVTTWVVYPERKGKAGVVIVIHEIFGLTDWVRAVADQLAADGFIAVAPDLLSGKGGTASLGEEVTKVIRTIPPEEVTAMLNAVRDHAIKLPASNGRSATIGFCWGGSTSFRYSLAQPALNGAVVYYGGSPDAAAIAGAKVPILGLYGGADERVNSTIPAAEEAMSKARASYTKHIYENAGHGFLRQQSGREGANMKASQQAWPATLEFLRKHLTTS